MNKIALPAELDALRAEIAASFDPDKRRVYVCLGTGCKACGGDEVLATLEKALKRARLHDKVEVVMTGGCGLCEYGALVAVHPPGALYCRVTPDDIPDIVEKSVKHGEVIKRLLYQVPATVAKPRGQRIAAEGDIPFYRHQERIVLGMNDRIDPTKIGD